MKITDFLEVMPVFVTHLVLSGFRNGVVNLKFGTARFTLDESGETIEDDLVVAADLRMDLQIATLLRDHLNRIIEQHSKPPRVTEH